MLRNVLDKLTEEGSVTRVPAINGKAYYATTYVGEYGGIAYTLAVTVLAYTAGGHRVQADILRGGKPVKRPPMQANWPVMKAVREITAGDQGDEVVARLLSAAF